MVSCQCRFFGLSPNTVRRGPLWRRPRALTFAFVLAPTLLMGATLPLLVAFAVRESGAVGRSVGMLYFVNTAGSALAAIAAALVLMGALGETGSARLAALVNMAVGTFVLSRHLLTRQATS